MRMKTLCSIFFLTTILLGCKPNVSSPNKFSDCTFVIPSLPNFDCYKNTAGTGSKIRITINLKTRYHLGSSSGANYIDITGGDKNKDFDPSSEQFPITIVAPIPNDTRTDWSWEVEVNITGLDCSPCANGYGDSQHESTGTCPSNWIVPGSNPWQYYAAYPRWNSVFRKVGYVTTFNLLSIKRAYNKPNSCNCSTP